MHETNMFVQHVVRSHLKLEVFLAVPNATLKDGVKSERGHASNCSVQMGIMMHTVCEIVSPQKDVYGTKREVVVRRMKNVRVVQILLYFLTFTNLANCCIKLGSYTKIVEYRPLVPTWKCEERGVSCANC